MELKPITTMQAEFNSEEYNTLEEAKRLLEDLGKEMAGLSDNAYLICHDEADGDEFFSIRDIYHLATILEQLNNDDKIIHY